MDNKHATTLGMTRTTHVNATEEGALVDIDSASIAWENIIGDIIAHVFFRSKQTKLFEVMQVSWGWYDVAKSRKWRKVITVLIPAGSAIRPDHSLSDFRL